MTRVEEISKAYTKYAQEGGILQSNPWFAFEAGAKWADQHLKNVWHSSEEDPKKNRYILIEVVSTLTPKDEIGYYIEYTKN